MTLTAQTRAVWQFFGHLTPLHQPTSGTHWGVYLAAGGPFSYKRGNRG